MAIRATSDTQNRNVHGPVRGLSDELAETSLAEPEGLPNAVGVELDDYLDEQEVGSFPASDPHSDWAGPPT